MLVSSAGFVLNFDIFLPSVVIIEGCKYLELVGDGYCHDENNKRQCDFDGGDCCYSNISTAFCSDCKCLTGDKGVEINRPLIGDGYCHDETNNQGIYIDTIISFIVKGIQSKLIFSMI